MRKTKYDSATMKEMGSDTFGLRSRKGSGKGNGGQAQDVSFVYVVRQLGHY